MSEANFHELLLHITNGVQCIADNHRIAPERIIFRDHLVREGTIPDNSGPLHFEDGDVEAYYDPEDKTIEVSRAWIQDEFLRPNKERFADVLNEEYPVTREQYAFLMGAEEATHHRQRFGGSRAARKGFDAMDRRFDQGDETGSLTDAAELEARKIVLSTARELGIISSPQKRVRTEL